MFCAEEHAVEIYAKHATPLGGRADFKVIIGAGDTSNIGDAVYRTQLCDDLLDSVRPIRLTTGI